MSTTHATRTKDKNVRGSYTRSIGRRIKITERDLKLFSLLLDLRLMNANHIAVWLDRDTPGKIRDMQDRLKLLFNKPNAYIDRVPSGQYFIEGGGSEPIIYALNSKGRRALIESKKEKYANISKRVNNKDLKPHTISHTLFNTEVATHIKQACNERPEWLYAPRGVIFDDMVTEELKNHPGRNVNNYYGWPLMYHVEKKDQYGQPVIVEEKGTLIPDYFSCIVNHHTENLFYIFTEVDNSTEPVERKASKLEQSDVWKKFALYDRSAKAQLFKKYLHLTSPFRILFITRSEERMENMIAANKNSEIRRGSGWHKFLFTTKDRLNEHGLLDVAWRNGEDDTPFYFRDLEL